MNGHKPSERIPVAARRAVIRVCIALAIADLALQAVVRVIHHSGAPTVVGIVPPVLCVLSGLYYLRSSRGRS